MAKVQPKAYLDFLGKVRLEVLLGSRYCMENDITVNFSAATVPWIDRGRPNGDGVTHFIDGSVVDSVLAVILCSSTCS